MTDSNARSMSDYYGRVIYRDSSPIITLSDTYSNIIVVYLGGNDYSFLADSGWQTASLDSYVSKYASLLTKIRNLNPSKNNVILPILVLHAGKSTSSATSSSSEMDDQSEKMKPLLERAVKDAGGDQKGIYLRTVNPSPSISFNDDSDWGSDQHWSLKAQKKFAAGYLPYVEELTGWKRSSNIVTSAFTYHYSLFLIIFTLAFLI